MAYIKNEWVDQNVERPRTYQMNENVDGSVTLIDDFGQITELGTPVNADNMNHIEDGVAGIAIRLFNLDETFALNEWVKDNEKIYKSKQDQNQGHATSETDWWEEVSLGGGMPVGSIIRSLANSVENGIYTNGTEFTKEQLPTFYNDWLIGGLISTITYDQYQTEITMTGECWSVALDRARETFKVPFIKDEVLRDVKASTSANGTIPVVGNGKTTIGLTNGADYLGLQVNPSVVKLTATLSAYGQPISTSAYADSNRNGALGLTTDPNNSGMIADLSSGNISTNTSKQVKTIKHFFIIATGSIKQSEMDWSRYMDGLNGKANIDLNNADKTKLLTGKITNCILEAPNGLLAFDGFNKYTVKAGTKVLLADGRNADGTLKNIEYVFTEDRSWSAPQPDFAHHIQFSIQDNIFGGWGGYTYYQEEEPPTGGYKYWYKPSENIWRRSFEGRPYEKVNLVFLARTRKDSGVAQVQAFSPYGTLQALSYNDASIISGWSMPSNKSINLSLGASGSKYIAPANGYFHIMKNAQSAGKFIAFALSKFYNGTGGSDTAIAQFSSNGDDFGVGYPLLLPVQQGDEITVYYSMDGDTRAFRFWYAEGDK